MKISTLTLLILFLNLSLFAQDLSKVDKVILSYMEPESIEELSERIDYDFKTKIEKVRAVYNWIALNIEYDVFNNSFLKSPEFIVYRNEYDKSLYEERRKDFLIKLLKTEKGSAMTLLYYFKKHVIS